MVAAAPAIISAFPWSSLEEEKSSPPLLKKPSKKFHVTLLLISHWPELSLWLHLAAAEVGKIQPSLGGCVY